MSKNAAFIFCFLWLFSMLSCAVTEWSNQKLYSALKEALNAKINASMEGCKK